MFNKTVIIIFIVTLSLFVLTNVCAGVYVLGHM